MKGMKLLSIIAISLFLMGVIGTDLLAYAKSDVPDDKTYTESVEDDDSSESEDLEEDYAR